MEMSNSPEPEIESRSGWIDKSSRVAALQVEPMETVSQRGDLLEEVRLSDAGVQVMWEEDERMSGDRGIYNDARGQHLSIRWKYMKKHGQMTKISNASIVYWRRKASPEPIRYLRIGDRYIKLETQGDRQPVVITELVDSVRDHGEQREINIEIARLTTRTVLVPMATDGMRLRTWAADGGGQKMSRIQFMPATEGKKLEPVVKQLTPSQVRRKIAPRKRSGTLYTGHRQPKL